jgi:hypothetical protein
MGEDPLTQIAALLRERNVIDGELTRFAGQAGRAADSPYGDDVQSRCGA